jgi:hypothetical protein
VQGSRYEVSVDEHMAVRLDDHDGPEHVHASPVVNGGCFRVIIQSNTNLSPFLNSGVAEGSSVSSKELRAGGTRPWKGRPVTS